MILAWIIIRVLKLSSKQLKKGFCICSLPLILQLQGRQGSSADSLKWFSLQRSQWGPSVLSLQLTQRPPLPVLRYCSMSNTHSSDLPLQLHSVSEVGVGGGKKGKGARGQVRRDMKNEGRAATRRGEWVEEATR